MVAHAHDPHADGHEHGHHGQGGHAHVWYFGVFIALIICTGLSWILDIVPLPSYPVKLVLVLAVACAKALFVMVYFMHLKFEGKWKFVLLAPTAILAIGLPLALLPDIGLSYYEQTADPQRAYAAEHPSGGEHGGADHDAGAADH